MQYSPPWQLEILRARLASRISQRCARCIPSHSANRRCACLKMRGLAVPLVFFFTICWAREWMNDIESVQRHPGPRCDVDQGRRSCRWPGLLCRHCLLCPGGRLITHVIMDPVRGVLLTCRRSKQQQKSPDSDVTNYSTVRHYVPAYRMHLLVGFFFFFCSFSLKKQTNVVLSVVMRELWQQRARELATNKIALDGDPGPSSYNPAPTLKSQDSRNAKLCPPPESTLMGRRRPRRAT